VASLDAKYDAILAREQQFALTVARKVVDKPELSVWMFLIPIVFIYYIHRYQKFQAGVKLFSKEFVFTKKAALDAAFQITRNGVSKDEALATCCPDEEAGSAADEALATCCSDTALVKEIRRKQFKEVAFLVDHYVRLLTADGDSYQSLVKKAYTRAGYRQFLKQLQQVEKEVNQAAKHAFKETEGFLEFMSKMEVATELLRQEETKKLFNGSNL